jgi:hypothetical protein
MTSRATAPSTERSPVPGNVLARSGADAEPDSVWLFGDTAWMAIEAKSNVDPAGQVLAEGAWIVSRSSVDRPATQSETGCLAILRSPGDLETPSGCVFHELFDTAPPYPLARLFIDLITNG